MESSERTRSSKKTRKSNTVRDDIPVISLPNPEQEFGDTRKTTTREFRLPPGNHSDYVEISTLREKRTRFGDESNDVIRGRTPPLPRRKTGTGIGRKNHNNKITHNSHGVLKDEGDESADYGRYSGHDIIPETSEMNTTYLNPVGSGNEHVLAPIPKLMGDNNLAEGSHLRRRFSSQGTAQQTVFIKLVFQKLGEIRTAQEDFAADIFIQAKWREDSLDRKEWQKDYELHNSEDYWNPEITIENCVGEVREKVWYMVTYDLQGHAYVCEKRKVKGIFSETMELGLYPFDTQRFTITMMSSLFESEVVLRKDPTNVDDVTLQTFSEQQEWTLHKQMEEFNHDILSWKSRGKTQPPAHMPRRPTLSLSLKATRRASYFLWNIVLFMIFICSLIFATFAVKYNLVQNRLQLAFILMLSNITFKREVSGNLPKISYMTYLDYYVVTQTMIMFLVSVWHAVVFQISNTETAKMADRIALIVLGGIYIMENVIFFFIWGAAVYKLKKFSSQNVFVN